jgi:hypothetical protein
VLRVSGIVGRIAISRSIALLLRLRLRRGRSLGRLPPRTRLPGERGSAASGNRAERGGTKTEARAAGLGRSLLSSLAGIAEFVRQQALQIGCRLVAAIPITVAATQLTRSILIRSVGMGFRSRLGALVGLQLGLEVVPIDLGGRRRRGAAQIHRGDVEFALARLVGIMRLSDRRFILRPGHGFQEIGIALILTHDARELGERIAAAATRFQIGRMRITVIGVEISVATQTALVGHGPPPSVGAASTTRGAINASLRQPQRRG